MAYGPIQRFEALPASQSPQELQDKLSRTRLYTRRKYVRYDHSRSADWDFFTLAKGVKPGWMLNISQGGCLLATTRPIEHRRWIRLVVKEDGRSLLFTAVGRVVRRAEAAEALLASSEESLDASSKDTEAAKPRHYYGIEFIHQLNPVILDEIKSHSAGCASCGSAGADIPDLQEPGKYYCVLCHLRQACHNLLVVQEQ